MVARRLVVVGYRPLLIPSAVDQLPLRDEWGCRQCLGVGEWAWEMGLWTADRAGEKLRVGEPEILLFSLFVVAFGLVWVIFRCFLVTRVLSSNRQYPKFRLSSFCHFEP